MSTFVYTALDPSGKTVKGRIDAETEQLVLSKLHDQQYHILSVNEDRARAAKTSVSGVSTSKKKCKLNSLVVFSRQFATMIDAGIAMVRCLDILEGQTRDPVLKPAITQCKKDVKGGLSLTDAFSKHPNGFSKLYVNMVKAAETGGILDKILDRLSGFLENEQEVRGKIKSAMIYPGTGASVRVFHGGGTVHVRAAQVSGDIPVYECGNAGNHAGLVYYQFGDEELLVCAAMAMVGGTFAYKWYARSEAGAWQIDRLKLKIPVIGELVQKMAISRFSRTFATLIASGVPMMRSLEIVGETSGNRVIAHAVDNARTAIREGQKISAPLASSGLFPPWSRT